MTRCPRLGLVLGIAALSTARPATAQDMDGVEVPDEQSVILERADRDRVKGDPEAPIRIVEISDFECPFCARFYQESYRAIDSIYVRSGIARYVWISFRSWAVDIGIEEESFADCLRNDQTAPLQVRDYESAITAGVSSTPFFVVGDSVAIRGMVPLETFRSAVDSLLVVRGHEVP